MGIGIDEKKPFSFSAVFTQFPRKQQAFNIGKTVIGCHPHFQLYRLHYCWHDKLKEVSKTTSKERNKNGELFHFQMSNKQTGTNLLTHPCLKLCADFYPF